MTGGAEGLSAATLAARVIEIYAAVGFLFALAFAARGAARVDPAARQSPVAFRALLVPGAALLWPWLLVRWWRGQPPPVERTAHRDAAMAPGDRGGSRPA